MEENLLLLFLSPILRNDLLPLTNLPKLSSILLHPRPRFEDRKDRFHSRRSARFARF